jgi:hypothetical protein
MAAGGLAPAAFLLAIMAGSLKLPGRRYGLDGGGCVQYVDASRLTCCCALPAVCVAHACMCAPPRLKAASGTCLRTCLTSAAGVSKGSRK